MKVYNYWELSEIIISLDGKEFYPHEKVQESYHCVHGVIRNGEIVLTPKEAEELILDLRSSLDAQYKTDKELNEYFDREKELEGK